MVSKSLLYAVSGAALLLIGCAETPKAEAPPIDKVEFNRSLVRVYDQEMARQAIIREMTVYGHHFDAGGSQLNELGRRDLLVIADHLKTNPGTVHLASAGVPEGLVEARRVAVREYLSGEGLPMDLIEVDAGLPGGEGGTARRVLRAVENEDRPLTSSSAGRGQSAAARTGSASQ